MNSQPKRDASKTNMTIRTANSVIGSRIEMTSHSSSCEASNSIAKLSHVTEMVIRDALSNGRSFCSVGSSEEEDSVASESLESSGG